MINPNIADNEGIYRSQIREFFEGKFGVFRDEGHYRTELKTFRSSYTSGEENGYTTLGNYGSFDNVYATKKDVIIGFIEYWLTGGYQKYNRHNKYVINIDNNDIPIGDETDFSTLYDWIIECWDEFSDIEELKQIATQDFANKIIRPNWLTMQGFGSNFSINFTYSEEAASQGNFTLYYSLDSITWINWPISDSNVTTTLNVNANSYIYIKNGSYNTETSNMVLGNNGIGKFSITSNNYVNVYGSIQSLIYGDDTENQYIACNHCFDGLFSNNSKINIGYYTDLPAIYLKPYCYANLFKNCTRTNTFMPDLPATTLAERCYMSMFEGCTGLISTYINPLPATTLAPYCYKNMFYGCTGINFHQDVMYLPATKLEEGCYENMFYGCTGMVQAPMLPAYKLAPYCYSGMFYGCISLVSAPELPATELEICCYENMFRNCTSLQKAPELPAKKLPQQAYIWMFYGCTSLSYVKALFTELTWGLTGAIHPTQDEPHSSIRGWLYNTNTSSSSILVLHTDFLTNKLYENINVISGLTGLDDDWYIAPTNWKIYGTRNYLHFKPTPSTSQTNCQSWKLTIHKHRFNDANPIYYDGSILDLNYRTTPYDISINTSTGAITNTYSWTHITTGSLSSTIPDITFSSDGIYITNALDYETRDIESDYRWYNLEDISDYHVYQHFLLTPLASANTQYIDIFGDIRSIFYLPETFEDYDDLPNNSYHNYWYDWSSPKYMFTHNTYIRHMYQTMSVKHFYANMYEASCINCANLVYLPNFGTDPLKGLNYATFNSTFSRCTSLEYIPELPYLTYSDDDYTCGYTEQGYEISGTFYTEPTGCYGGMFSGCNNIKFLPNIFPLRSLCRGVYGDMFNMWSDTESLRKSEFKKMPELIGITGINDCVKAMFAYCDLKEVQCIPLTTIVDDNKSIYGTFRGMFVYNQNLKTVMHTLPLRTLLTNTYLGMFEDCRKLAVAPKIQAQGVNTDCMKWAFLRCYNLKYTNTSVTSTTTTPFNSTGSNTWKNYSYNWENEDKKGLLWIDNGQFSGLSRGYYKAALIQYSKNPQTNIYEYDGDYWIYVKSRKFANSETYYIWRKYIEDDDNFNHYYKCNTDEPVFYVITRECIIPECKITSLSQATNMTTISKQYTIVGYTYADFDFSNAPNSSEDFDYSTIHGDIHGGTDSPKIFPKVLLSVTEQPQPD